MSISELFNTPINRRRFIGTGTASVAAIGMGLLGTRVSAQESTPTTAIDRIMQAATDFLAALSESEREQVLFDWSNEEQKRRWSNLPAALSQRDGLMWGNLGEGARSAWLPVMQATLSEEGYARVIGAWEADEVLRVMEEAGELGGGGGQGGPGGDGGNGGGQGGPGGNGGSDYSSDYFYIAIIGEPSAETPWQWQFTGHHTTVNATFANGRISLTPSFFGCQPMDYTDETGNAVRPIGDVNDAAFTVINALDADQQAQAVTSNNRTDLETAPGIAEVRELDPEGILVSELTEEQQALVTELVSKYTGTLNEEHAAARLAEVTDVYDQTWFVWRGPTAWDSDAYWRVSGPTLIMEYAPQDQLTNDPRQHVHAIYRDPSNEYGVKYQ